jgi:hypothetical protein
MDECIGFNCCIRPLIDNITNGGEKWCRCNLEMMRHSCMYREFKASFIYILIND